MVGYNFGINCKNIVIKTIYFIRNILTHNHGENDTVYPTRKYILYVFFNNFLLSFHKKCFLIKIIIKGVETDINKQLKSFNYSVEKNVK